MVNIIIRMMEVKKLDIRAMKNQAVKALNIVHFGIELKVVFKNKN